MLQVNKLTEAAEALNKAVRIAEDSGERWYLPELWRLQGVVHLRRGEAAEASSWLHKAIALARQQGARFWELRSAVTLGHHLHQQGRTAEALEWLRPIRGWFTQGLDTPDVEEARRLIAELDTNTRGVGI